MLGDVLVNEALVPEQFYISDEKLPDWRYLKGSKREERTNKKTGFTYTYSEGAMSFPDAIDKPSRTILTGEGGTGASRFKHVIECPDGRFRRLVPDDARSAPGFPKGWTDTGMTDGHRASAWVTHLSLVFPTASVKPWLRCMGCSRTTIGINKTRASSILNWPSSFV